MERRSFLQKMTSFAIVGFTPSLLHATLFDKNATTQNLPVHFIGLGDTGSKVLTKFHDAGFKGYFTSINNHFPAGLHPSFTRLEWNDFTPSDTNTIAPLTTDIKKLFIPKHHYVLLAGLSGNIGTKLASELYRFLKSNDKEFKIIVSMPYHFEGTGKTARANNFISCVQNDNKVFSFSYQDIYNKYGNMLLSDGLALGHEKFKEIYLNEIARKKI